MDLRGHLFSFDVARRGSCRHERLPDPTIEGVTRGMPGCCRARGNNVSPSEVAAAETMTRRSHLCIALRPDCQLCIARRSRSR